MDTRTQMLINEYIIRLSEGDLLPEHLVMLESVLDNNPEAIAYFVDCAGDLSQCEALLQRTIMISQDETDREAGACDMEIRDAHLWDALLYQEQTAPSIPEPVTASEPEMIPKVERGKVIGRFDKRALFSFITSAAAIFLLVLFIHLIPPRPVSVEVATLADTISAKWANTTESMKPGLRLSTGAQPFILREGLAEMVFDNNARVTVEGPAEFEIISEDRVKLRYGRLYSTVPQEALGFSVATPNAMIIDLGTQFGTFVDFQGNTELHVTEGKTTLVAGEDKAKVSLEVTEGQARKIDNQSSEIADISCNESFFARAINSRSNFVWRGQRGFDLADVVGGGNGFGTGRLSRGLDPLTGRIIPTGASDRTGNGRFMPVVKNPYVDGVFVPAGQNPPVIISSGGHIFTDCPATNNIFYMEIINSQLIDPAVPVLWKELPAGTGIYGTATCPSIFMHANLGVTFDLEAIRNDLAGVRLSRFLAEALLSPMATREGNVDIWVLVDGNVRYCQKNISEKGVVYPIEVQLQGSDRFLTLVTTDGGDVDFPEPEKRATDSDWALFARARLELSAAGDK